MVRAYVWGQIMIQDKCIKFKENNSMHLMGYEVRSCRGRYVSAHMMQLQVHATLPKKYSCQEELNQASVCNYLGAGH